MLHALLEPPILACVNGMRNSNWLLELHLLLLLLVLQMLLLLKLHLRRRKWLRLWLVLLGIPSGCGPSRPDVDHHLLGLERRLLNEGNGRYSGPY